MSFSQRLFARFLASGDAPQHRLYSDLKRELFDDLHDTVVEIGPGTGVNLPYYPRGIRWIGIEPNPHMHRYIHEKADARGMEIELLARSAADTGLPDDSADAVVSTLVLCSVPDVDAALTEIRRVLKPGGHFYFIEHVAAAKDRWLRTLQNGLTPVWHRLADGCHLNRETGTAIEAAGFREVQIRAIEVDAPIVSPHIIGVATV